MKRTVLKLGLVFAAAALFAPVLLADTPSNEQVDKEINEITEHSDFKWLKNPSDGTSDPKHTVNDQTLNKRSRLAEDTSPPDCGYHPQDSRAPQTRESVDHGPAPSCAGGSTPTSSPLARGDSSSDCGSISPGACSCDRAGGNCEFNPTPPDCGCGGIGSVTGPMGYLIAGLALAALVFFIVWSLARRDNGPSNDDPGGILETDSPEDVRLSQLPQTPFEQMMSQAEASARRGDYKSAVGWCYLAGIAELHRKGFIDLRLSTTNLEIVVATRRRNGPHKNAEQLIRIFEDIYFGDRPPNEERWLQAKQIVEATVVTT